MSERDITVLQDGQLAVSTVEQTGTIITGASAIDTTCLVQTEKGVQNCVKTFPLGGGGGGGTTTVTKWFDNVSGTTLNTGITGASVSVYKDGQLLQPGTAITAKLYKGGSGKSLVLAQTAPLSTASSWSIKTRVRWVSDGTSATPAVYAYSGTTDRQAPCLATASQSHLGMFMSSNGSSWDIDDAFYSSLVPQDGVTYDFDTSFTGTKYQFKYSTDLGKNWTIERDIANSSAIYCVSPFRFLNNNLSSSYYNASVIEWSVTQIIIDGQVWFDGATAVEGTDYTNDGCTLTEVPSSTNDYHYDTTTGVITFSAALANENIAVEYGKSTGGGVTDYDALTSRPQINSVTLTGNKTASDLHLQSATSIVTLTTASTELATNTIYNGGELASVTLTLPATVPADFIAQVEFTSGAIATTFTAPATVTFEGNDCSNGVFTPLASKRYSVMVYSDGVNVIGLVMGN